MKIIVIGWSVGIHWMLSLLLSGCVIVEVPTVPESSTNAVSHTSLQLPNLETSRGDLDPNSVSTSIDLGPKDTNSTQVRGIQHNVEEKQKHKQKQKQKRSQEPLLNQNHSDNAGVDNWMLLGDDEVIMDLEKYGALDCRTVSCSQF